MVGREEQLELLNQKYQSEQNHFTILYGRRGIGKTTFLSELLKDKKAAYYEARQCAAFEQLQLMSECMDYPIAASGYYDIFDYLLLSGIRLIVIEEFQHIVKVDSGLMDAIIRLLKQKNQPIMVICTSSSVSWVENSMVRTIGAEASFMIQTFVKLKELNYMDMVSIFPDCDTETILHIYAITGGVPAYVRLWDPAHSIEENVCDLVLSSDGPLYREAETYIAEEFRESSIYHTLLHCLAIGNNKLNEIHEYTGYGRDKISVYLKALIEREIVEKVFSYDISGKENTRKGLYRIREAFLLFWFRFIYSKAGVLQMTDVHLLYQTDIQPMLKRFCQDAFIKVAENYLTLMNSMKRLPGEYEYKGAWHGKQGELHIIFVEESGISLVGEVFVGNAPATMADYDYVKETVSLAGLQCEQYYLFSLSGFDKELKACEGASLHLISIEEL